MNSVDTISIINSSKQSLKFSLVDLYEIVEAINEVEKNIIDCNQLMETFIKDLEHYDQKISKIENSIEKKKMNKLKPKLKKNKNVSREKKKPHAYNNYISAVVKEGFPKVRIEMILYIFCVSYMLTNYNLI